MAKAVREQITDKCVQVLLVKGIEAPDEPQIVEGVGFKNEPIEVIADNGQKPGVYLHEFGHTFGKLDHVESPDYYGKATVNASPNFGDLAQNPMSAGTGLVLTDVQWEAFFEGLKRILESFK